MKNRSKFWMMALALAAAAAVSLTGCGEKLNKETETETQTETQRVTEPPTERVTETEKVTESETETETETETEPALTQNTTPEEELGAETELSGSRTLYAADNVNVRSEPSTEADIISSYDQGQEVTIIAETPNWYKVQMDGYTGYAYKENLSETAVEPKSPEEQQQLLEEQGYASGSDTSSVDMEYDVTTYAESFSLTLSSDANVRSEPSLENGSVVTALSEGTSVTAVGETNRWYKIEYDGTVGYVNKNMVE